MVDLGEMFGNDAVQGEGYIIAEVVADSVNYAGDRLTTFRLHYPRFIHGEVMTHRMLSRNASSSRAIPVSRMIEQVESMPAMPIHWGKNKAGMQADEEHDEFVIGWNKEFAWQEASGDATYWASEFLESGYHKQIVNRLIEPFQFMNVVLSATDYENFFWLRYHPDAQPEIAELARVMHEAREKSTPQIMRDGEWHTPYVDHLYDLDGNFIQYEIQGQVLTEQQALAISSSACAQASYRKLDLSIEKSLDIYNKLVTMKPIHASPFEHIATPMSEAEYMKRKGMLHSFETFLKESGLPIDAAQQAMYNGNFRGWNQMRKLLPDENLTEKFEKPLDI